jgi:uncharacterized protein YjbJ (UPF0337 family)
MNVCPVRRGGSAVLAEAPAVMRVDEDWRMNCMSPALTAPMRQSVNRQGVNMNRDQMKGMAQQVKGKVNEVVGKATGNRTQQLKGDLQQAAGTARKAYGDGKQKIRKLGR